ncbi:hypothetical protein Rumeso_01093 [Rubellimicrobium mesophilum DSM 19309]|uniref:SH3b domain-containing protein n=1 Tax=Rubellimicrobium mesophilum DSM 19309 TaxID=442562 RepID=A0A017HSM9_9RHOB|nr:SH3 domain-containing protein [Rubellimicrobium mesophilum]EYD77386.1 hypothetical protein Rumeso_01093 [Rubellimicrobium mesophilum DSM 19309]
MRRGVASTLLALALLAGCSAGGAGEASRVVVQGAGPDEFLKLRTGPGLGYRIVLGLPDGTQLIRRDCVTEGGQLWCRVSLSAAPQITGYVSADYLSAI